MGYCSHKVKLVTKIGSFLFWTTGVVRSRPAGSCTVACFCSPQWKTTTFRRLLTASRVSGRTYRGRFCSNFRTCQNVCCNRNKRWSSEMKRIQRQRGKGFQRRVARLGRSPIAWNESPELLDESDRGGLTLRPAASISKGGKPKLACESLQRQKYTKFTNNHFWYFQMISEWANERLTHASSKLLSIL